MPYGLFVPDIGDTGLGRAQSGRNTSSARGVVSAAPFVVGPEPRRVEQRP
jgi:hypothetical protein